MTKNCRHCKKTYNAAFQECPFCGAPALEDESKLNVVLNCPHCEVPLKNARLRDNQVDLCPECMGLWLDSDQFAYLVSKRDVYKDDAVPKKYERKPLPFGKDTLEYIPCPRCNGLMNTW